MECMKGMGMKVSDYIVDFFVEKGVTDVFGYPGGMVTHLMDSFYNKRDKIAAHVNYHEQASAFCACGYAQVTGKAGVAYATSGPGATNLITGICDAYFDSIPTIYITGQVNTFESKGHMNVRQRGFQETDIVAVTEKITKYSSYVGEAENIRYELEKAWYIAHAGRKGPVLLDIPADILRAQIEPESLQGYGVQNVETENIEKACKRIAGLVEKAKRPVLLVGAGIKAAGAVEDVRAIVQKWNVPVVSSMLACDIFAGDTDYYYGFIGAYGMRRANFIVAKADLVVALGSRMDVRQVGAKRADFAPNATLLRVDIDAGELEYKVHEDEVTIRCDAKELLEKLYDHEVNLQNMEDWILVCKQIAERLGDMDCRKPNELLYHFSKKIPEDVVITTDVGQNQVWIAQSFELKKGQRVFFSGGHGAMGYSLPAAIGAYYATKEPVICFSGDGGIQMNIQELQFISREQIPVIIVILNNNALGMIRHFQEMYFDSVYCQTTENGGYTAPNFERIAKAYDIAYNRIQSLQDVENYSYEVNGPQIVEMILEGPTYVFPKLEFGKPNQDQEPLLERGVYNELMAL